MVNGSQAPATSKEKQSGQLSLDRQISDNCSSWKSSVWLIVQVPGMMVSVVFRPLE